MKVRTTPTFDRAEKKLLARDKKTVADAVREVMDNPNVGEVKKGDLAGVFVHKFKINKQEILLSYRLSKDELLLIALGSHENFYRDMKR
ncbi:MAG: type II toxin-antitoxin system RelE/ParE family toxin [Sulfuricella sp.]|nr:type II toxin-antitoxin system RelE/ParE family toxin [Sulfuricella sp.]